MTAIDRRTFLASSAASVAGLSARSYARAADSPNEKVALAIIGIGSTVPGSVGGRGRHNGKHRQNGAQGKPHHRDHQSLLEA